MEQIQVRKSQINREILANDSEIAEENESLNKFQNGIESYFRQDHFTE